MRVTSTTRSALFTIIASFVLAGPSMALGADTNQRRNEVVAFEEQSIGGADMPTPTASPTPAGGAAASPGAAASAAANASPGATGSQAAQASPGEQQSPSSEESPGAAGSAAAQASPSAAPTDVPPALDIGSVAPSLQVSDTSLSALIATAQDPSRVASLRATEQARKEFVDGHLDDAIRDLGSAVSIDPSNGYAYLYLGRAYIAKKDYTQAETFLKRAEVAFGADPQWHAEALAFQGVAYEESGQQAQAAAAYQKALAVTPGNLTARVGATRLADFAPPPPGGAPAPDGSALQPPPAGGPVPGAPPEAEPPPAPPPGPPPEANPDN
jgi:Flp pilus assembly protein TadD